MNSLETDMMGADEDVPLATMQEIVLAIVERHAVNDTDIWETATQLAEIIEPLGLSLSDIREGMPRQRMGGE